MTGGYQLASTTDMPRRSSYRSPFDVHETTLKEILAMSGRGKLEASQLDFLDRAAAQTGRRELTIYYAGEIGLARKRAISVIGTRDVSDEGRKRANRFARELADMNIVVVSGLAAGVDTQALGSAIAAGGEVIAVIGTPIDKAYPAANGKMQELIYSDHLLISQFPSGQRTYPSDFPARNRTMAALSDASVIIEASETSGTLHQAAECVRLGRWLGISKSVVEDPRLKWPQKFIAYEKCVVLESTASFVERIYAQ